MLSTFLALHVLTRSITGEKKAEALYQSNPFGEFHIRSGLGSVR
jgi:hypothetical protein